MAETGHWPDVLTARQAVLLEAGVHAVAWDLEFPEIFPTGFSVVLGNPPWDVVQHNTKDFELQSTLATVFLGSNVWEGWSKYPTTNITLL